MNWLNPLRRAVGLSTFSTNRLARNGGRPRVRPINPRLETLEDRLTPTTFTVMTNSDAVVHNGRSLRDAITLANADSATGGSDTIVFDSSLQGKTIVLAQGPLNLKGTGSITIDDQTNNITLSGGNVSNILVVDAGTTATMLAFSFVNGRIISGNTDVQAGGIQNAGTLTIDASLIDSNSAITQGATNNAFGGGLYNTGTLTITNSTISNNLVNAVNRVFGGGVYNTGTLHLTNTHVDNNSSVSTTVQTGLNIASQGTGIYSTGPVTIDGGSTVNSNVASGSGTPLLGGGIFTTSTLSIDATTIKGNSAAAGGGGIYSTGATVTLSNSNVLSNTGGGIFATGTLTITNTSINNNTLSNTPGAGIASSGPVSITGGTVSGNSNTCASNSTTTTLVASGGVYSTGSIVLNGVTVSGNVGISSGTAAARGVGVYTTSTLTVTNCTISGNAGSTSGTALLTGMGIFAGGTLTIAGTTVASNSGSSTGTAGVSGVGIYSGGGLTVDSSTITSNTGTSTGGAISGVGLFLNQNLGGLITETTISNNKSAASGGASISGIGVFNLGTMTIYECTISSNVMASGFGAIGGGIFNGGTMTLTVSTVYGNAADQGGGAQNGLPSNTGATLTISECTFADNTATTVGGGLYNQGQMVLRSTVMAHETAPSGPDVGVDLTVLSQLLGEHDLIEHLAGLEKTEIADGVNENIVGHDPKIYDVLANYGGQTQTIPLLVGSPAIGNGGVTDISAAILDDTTTTIPVENTAVFMSNFVSRVVQLDDEEMLITGFNLAASTLTVQRGYNNTTAATHVKFTHVFPTTDQLGLDRVVNHTTDIGASTFIKDVTPPTVSITGTPPAITNSTTATFTFAGLDDFTPPNLLVFKVSLDGGAFVTATSPDTITGLTAATHTFQVEAIDEQGNIGMSAIFQWIVDLQAPTVSLTQNPPSITNSTTATFAFSGTDDITPPGQLVFMTSLDGSTPALATSPQVFNGLAEGQHTFTVESFDQAGNGSTVLQYTWTIDITNPTVSITQNPPAATKSTTAVFGFTGADNFTTTANLVFKVSLDGSAFTVATSPKTYTGLSSADHTFSVEAVDQAGNVSSVESYTWTVDAIPPTVQITQAPAAQTQSTSATFAFTGTDNRTSTANLVFQVSLDGSPFTAQTSPVIYTNLATGSHTFQVVAIDEVGNTSTPATFTWIVDQTPPVAAITLMPPNPTNQTTATFTFTGTDNVTAANKLVFQVSLDGAAFSTTTSPASFIGLADGSHTFQVEAIDQALNVSNPVSFTWVIDTVPPTVSITQEPAPITNQTTATFAFAGSDNLTTAINLVFQYSLDGAAFKSATNPLVLPAIAAGTHSIAVQSIDQAGNHSSSATFSWTVDVTLPTVAITAKPPTLSNAGAADFSFTGNDDVTPLAQLVFKYSIDGSAFTAAASPLHLPGLASGSHTFQVESVDQAGNTSAPASYTWTVDAIAPTVSFTSTPPFATQSFGGTFVFTGSDNLTPLSSLVFQGSLDGSPFSVVTSPLTFNDLPLGPHIFVLHDADEAGNVSVPVSFTWNIDQVAPTASIIQNPPSTSFVTTATFAFTGSDDVSSTSQLTFKTSLDGAPFLPATSPVNYSNLVLGKHTFLVEAVDQAGNVGTPMSYTWTVAIPPPASQLQFSASGYGIVRTQNLINLIVVRTGSLAVPVTVDYSMTGGTAVGGTDFKIASGTLKFPVGALTEMIPITIMNAGTAGAQGKSFTVTLTNSTNGATLPGLLQAMVTINDPLTTNPLPGNLNAAAKLFIHSPEARADFVQQAYLVYLHRPAEQNGLDFWSAQLAAGFTDEQLEAQFIGSSEYIFSHGGTGSGWVTGMYQDLLGRAPDSNGLNFWVGQFNAGVSPVVIALGFAASQEREANVLSAAYQTYLGRAIDTGAMTAWLNAFAHGTSNEDIVAALVGSQEYYNNPAKGQRNEAQWVRRAMDDILHREASDGDIAFWTNFLS